MGKVVNYECVKCGYSVSLNTGPGMFHARYCERELESIKNGKRGKELQELVNGLKSPGIEIWDYVFICEKCKELMVDSSLEIYEQIEELPENIISNDCYSGAPRVCNEKMKKYYKLVYEKPHLCHKCNGKLTLTSETVERCPKCNEAMRGKLYTLYD